jgi:hypothetical protein
MRPRFLLCVPIVLLLLVAGGCAGPNKLAKQSRVALMQGDLRKAYDKARRGVEKDPENAAARSAFGAAATQIATDYRERIARMAPGDTVDAARLAIEFRQFRAEVARYPVPVATDPADLDREAALCRGAARILYRGGDESFAARRPKEAYRQFNEAAGFDPGYRDVSRRVTETLDRALTDVAILPFEDQVGVNGLSADLAARMQQEVLRRCGSPALFFTRVVDDRVVMDNLSVRESRRMTRDDALAIGRRVHADRVVCGRYTGLQVDNNTSDFTVSLYSKVTDKGPDGQPRDRWVETPVDVLVRQRNVRVAMTFEVLDTRTGEVLETQTVPREAFARVAWTSYRADGDCDRFQLAPPAEAQVPADRVRRSQERWKESMGSWSVSAFLDRARQKPERRAWAAGYRSDFYGDSRQRPVWLAELPGVDDMVYLALRNVDEPVIAALRDIDGND